MEKKKTTRPRATKKQILRDHVEALVENENREAAKVTMEDVKEVLDGVTYHRIYGAECPRCKMRKAHVRNTLPWEDNLRERYHCCRRCGATFKSIEDLSAA